VWVWLQSGYLAGLVISSIASARRATL
jgi:hypothetical protein